MRGIEGKVAIVTGGGAGIGRAIVRRLADEGAVVAVVDIKPRPDGPDPGEPEPALWLVCDVSDSAQVDSAFEQLRDTLGAPAILVNNAGAIGLDHLRRVTPLLARQRAEAEAGEVPSTPLDALVRLTDDEWHRMLGIHLDGTFFCTRAAVRAMAPRHSGIVINMASICGLEGCAGHPHYSAAKGAILGFTKAAAKELIVEGIRVNAVAPGHVGTSTLQGEISDQRASIARSTPAGRLATPAEVAATVAFLASDDAAYYIGAVLSPNGGLVMA